MKVNFYTSGDPVHDLVLRHLYIGCPEDDKHLVPGFHYDPADVAVLFGVYKSRVKASWPRGLVYEQQRRDGGDCLILETGYVNRGDGIDNHYAAGFNGLNNRADFKNKGMPGDRAKALGVDLKPWSQPQAGHILVCGQVPWDASCEGVDVLKELSDAADLLAGVCKNPIIYRPHPLAKTELPGIPTSLHPNLLDDLQGAFCCVTYNSNSAVDAVIAGVPVLVIDPGSMAWDMSKAETATPDRAQWFADLAYAQWTPEEFRSGIAWKHLFR